jgi:hypothetical protein
VINVPVDVNNKVRQLPRRLDDDYAFNVNIKKNHLHGFVRKSVVRAWLAHLVNTPLYKHYNIQVDSSVLDVDASRLAENNIASDDEPHIECVSVETMPESELLAARQHTLLWNENHCLHISPGQHSTPMNIIYDNYAKELSFPSIYYGHPCTFSMNISVTPYMIATSEICRRDRCGVTPQHVLYMAMKILRLRVVDGIYNTFRCVRENENITRRMLEDRQFMEEYVEKKTPGISQINP